MELSGFEVSTELNKIFDGIHFESSNNVSVISPSEFARVCWTLKIRMQSTVNNNGSRSTMLQVGQADRQPHIFQQTQIILVVELWPDSVCWSEFMWFETKNTETRQRHMMAE